MKPETLRTHPCRCIKCDKEMDNYLGARGYQPGDGLAFYTQGHYGSTHFDPMDGTSLHIAVCDDCIAAAEARGIVRREEPHP